jgi:hypothetical protein
MQIQVTEVNDPRVFDYALFPEQNPMNYLYIQQNMTGFSDKLTESGLAFMEHHRQVYSAIDHSEIARKARQVMRAVKGLFTPDTIVPLESLEDMQNAQLQMQRYMMAEPTLRAMYHKNRADGFRDTYEDMEPGRIGENHLDYRKVMTGTVMQTEEGGWVARQYFDELPEEDRPLDHAERMIIQRTWAAMKNIILTTGQDPSNVFGGEIGG